VPELPEVETVVRTLAPHLTGATVLSIEGADLPIVGERVEGVSRYGKFVVIEFARGKVLIHLRMTGKLLFNGARGKYTRAEFLLDQGVLLFDDIRRFGRITWSSGDLPEQGPDPLEVTADDFAQLLGARRGRIKAMLLNQRILRGLGNIYVDEALHRARIHPLIAGLSRVRLMRLHQAITEVLTEAIAAGGSSISDYVDGEGKAGSFQKRHRVYGRAGEPCLACGCEIVRTVIGQRGTHLCPQCQKKR
jgi:formamidopyrimidine-DNA glycosylase